MKAKKGGKEWAGGGRGEGLCTGRRCRCPRAAVSLGRGIGKVALVCFAGGGRHFLLRREDVGETAAVFGGEKIRSNGDDVELTAVR